MNVYDFLLNKKGKYKFSTRFVRIGTQYTLLII